MKACGIIMDINMVRALLLHQKFVTRRLSKSWLDYKRGDTLWVKELWCDKIGGFDLGLSYRANHFYSRGDDPAHPITWKSPMSMPCWVSRISMTLTEDARLEKLHDLTSVECIAEGFKNNVPMRSNFATYWDSLYPSGKRWADNPEVVRLSWKQIQPIKKGGK